jgi:hypothetical protein
LFGSEITFLCEFYPIIIINIVYFIWFILALFARKYLDKRHIGGEKGLPLQLLDRLAGRLINFYDQVWRYQFLSTLWLCLIQFYNLAYPVNADRSSALNATICILSFICTLTWPAFLALYCRQKYYN